MLNIRCLTYWLDFLLLDILLDFGDSALLHLPLLQKLRKVDAQVMLQESMDTSQVRGETSLCGVVVTATEVANLLGWFGLFQ